MPKYRVKYVYEQWYDLDVEATSKEEALDIFHAGTFKEDPRLVGGEVQDSIVVEEVKQ